MAAIVLTAGTSMAIASEEGKKPGNYCMDVEIEPFHMLPGPFIEPESCPVRDYWDGELQEMFYPFTIEDHLLNCEFADFLTLPVVGMVPTWVVSEGEDPGMPGEISGTIDGHPFAATLYCASMTNWYQDSCSDPADPDSCTFQLAQPFLSKGLPFPRVTEVSVFDGAITVESRGNKTVDVPIVLATRAAGITHVEDPAAPLVGASITHSLLGLVIDDAEGNGKGKGRDAEVLDASADLLLQGHIFFPGPVEDDLTPEGENAAAVIKGSICSEDLYKRLNRKGGQGHHD
jgi:hypothetical protein